MSPTKLQLLRLLQHHSVFQPNIPVSLTKIARTLGLPRQRVHTLYHQLALDYNLPSVAKPGFGQLDQKTKHTIASLGGKAVHAQGKAHYLTEDEVKRGQQTRLLKRTRKRNSSSSIIPLAQTTKSQLLKLLQRSQSDQPNMPVSLSDLAQTLGVSRERIRQLYNELVNEYELLPSVKKPGGWSKKRTQEHKINYQVLDQKVKALREKGMDYQQIKQELGISAWQVRLAIKRLKSTGETPRKLTSQKTLAFEAKVRELSAQGMGASEIARKIGMSAASVLYALNRLNVPLSQRRRGGYQRTGRRPGRQPRNTKRSPSP
jgi:biotin operon repressor